MLIATLVAPERLSAGDVSAARDALTAAGAQVGETAWIDADVAADLAFSNLDRPAARVALEDAGPFDVIVQPFEHRAKRLLIADMDSTMITVECIDELADYAGLKAEVAAVTEAAMRGELDFAAALDARVALLKGMDAAVIDRCREERVRLTPGARTLVQTMRSKGARTVLVSGGFTAFTDNVAAQIGFDRAVANRLDIESGKLRGSVARPIVDADVKRRTLYEEAAALAIPLEATLAVGDGANDIPMIEAAGLGIAYRAKPKTRAAADAAIDRCDLTALLYAQGYPRSDWAV